MTGLYITVCKATLSWTGPPEVNNIPNKVYMFVPPKEQPVCPPIRATRLSPNKGNLFVPQ